MAASWLDFDAVRREASFAKILEHYGLKTVGTGERCFVVCPFHQEMTPSCSIHLRKGLFHCFGCGAAGTVIDFVARMERADVKAAARLTAQISTINHPNRREDIRIASEDRRPGTDRSLKTAQAALKALELDPSHPYLAQRGLGRELIDLFGLGFCSRGPMRGRICIPIHDAEGTLVAYAGRWASDAVPHGIPRYLVSPGFQKRRVLFNINRVPRSEHVVLVEGYWSVLRLHALGVPGLGLMGCALDAAQIDLLKVRGVEAITLLLDGDQTGYRARERLAPLLATDFYVHAPLLNAGEKPDSMGEHCLLKLVKCRPTY